MPARPGPAWPARESALVPARSVRCAPARFPSGHRRVRHPTRQGAPLRARQRGQSDATVLPEPSLRRDPKVAPVRFGPEDGVLDGREARVAAPSDRGSERSGNPGKAVDRQCQLGLRDCGGVRRSRGFGFGPQCDPSLRERRTKAWGRRAGRAPARVLVPRGQDEWLEESPERSGASPSGRWRERSACRGHGCAESSEQSREEIHPALAAPAGSTVPLRPREP